MSPIIPVPEPRTRSSLVLDKSTWDALDRVAEESKATHPPNGLSRNDVIEHFLKWALGQYETEKTSGKTTEGQHEKKKR